MKNLVALLLGLTVAGSWAQLYPQKPGFLECTALRLGEADLRFELKTNSKQNATIVSAFSSHGAKQRALSGQLATAKPESYGAIQAKIEALESATAKQILKTLTSAQRQRLWELAIQNEGPFALRNAEVAKRVGLTADQKLKVESIAKRTANQSDELNASMGTELETAKGNTARTQIVKKYEPKLKAIEAKGEAEVLALLSKAQVTKWQRAKGTPFKR